MTWWTTPFAEAESFANACLALTARTFLLVSVEHFAFCLVSCWFGHSETFADASISLCFACWFMCSCALFNVSHYFTVTTTERYCFR